MRILTRRVHVLFEEERYQELAAWAREEGRTVGSVIRDATDQALEKRAGGQALEKRAGGQALEKRAGGQAAAFERLVALARQSDAAAGAPRDLTVEEWRVAKHDSHTAPGAQAAREPRVWRWTPPCRCWRWAGAIRRRRLAWR
ncbi:MAG: hypothetical protein LBO20_08455 [Bifidobacteriaceae bacterium]|jgi:hypothetical protein|nr:hypothetical protein [Bifidobacteriaceae bacterium]